MTDKKTGDDGFYLILFDIEIQNTGEGGELSLYENLTAAVKEIKIKISVFFSAGTLRRSKSERSLRCPLSLR